jgi:hypothetical protein
MQKFILFAVKRLGKIARISSDSAGLCRQRRLGGMSWLRRAVAETSVYSRAPFIFTTPARVHVS